MRIFVLSMFWTQVASFSIIIAIMIAGQYPRIEERGLSYDVARIFIALAFGIWSAFVLWVT
jgi:hypothetical protein